VRERLNGLPTQNDEHHDIGAVVPAVKLEQLVPYVQSLTLWVVPQRLCVSDFKAIVRVVGVAEALLQLTCPPILRLQMVLVLAVHCLDLPGYSTRVKERLEEELGKLVQGALQVRVTVSKSS